MNRLKQITALFLAAALLAGCTGIPVETESPAVPTAPGVQAVPKETPVEGNIHDNQALYQGRELTSVIDMYLTVSTGNEADSSDHSWEEVNAHSVYYYEDLGVERYKVEGLLQIDDGNGEHS